MYCFLLLLLPARGFVGLRSRKVFVPDVSALPHPMAPQRPHRGLVVAQVHGGDDAPGAGERAPRTMRKDFIGGDFDWSLAWSDFAMGRNPETPVKLNDWDSEFKEYVRRKRSLEKIDWDVSWRVERARREKSRNPCEVERLGLRVQGIR